MTKHEMASYWMNKARDELETDVIMFKSRKYLYTGFMCHQCIEKALKSYYIYTKDERQPFEHNLIKLTKEAGLFNNLSSTQFDTISRVNPLYINTRYDDYEILSMNC